MADLTYIVLLSHKDRGVGFSVREALKNAQKQDASPIKQAKFLGKSSTSNSKIEVKISDGHLQDIIRKTIDGSGRTPNQNGVYTIECIELQEEDDTLNDRINDLQRQNSASQRQLTALRDENARLRQDLSENRIEVNTPLEGLFAYFETTNYSPEIILKGSEDLDFARRVFGEEIENRFVNYVNHVLGENFSDKDVEEILSYEPKDTEEINSLRSKYEAAKKELEFLDKLKSGDTDIPETLCADYIKVIEKKKPDETVREYETQTREQEELKSKQAKLIQLKEKYEPFSDQIDLLTQAGAEIPVVFNFEEENMEMYFPFKVRDTKAGFIEDLRKEVETYFEDVAIEYLDSRFVAYQINNGENVIKCVLNMINDTPVTLRVAGFSNIKPYSLGK